MKVLKSRLYDLMEEEKNKDRADARKSQVGTGIVLKELELTTSHKEE